MAQQLADGGHDLQLAGAFVDVRHADITVMALHVELSHVSHSAVDLYRLEANPIAHLGSIVLNQRG